MIPLDNDTLAGRNTTETPISWGIGHVILLLLILMVIFGNALVIVAVLLDRKLRTVTTNKFIASLAVSDILVGIVVMPLSLYYKVHNDEWTLGYAACRFHLVSGIFSTTASIVHLVAISIDRYFAIMFPTEYQRHSISTSTIPYLIFIWVMSLGVASSLLFDKQYTQSDPTMCWIENPQYMVLSSLLSFYLPGVIVVYLYIKIFMKLRKHHQFMFGHQHNQKPIDKRRSLPRVIIEEVRSRRGSRLSQTGSSGGSPTRRGSKERSPSQPDIHSTTAKPQQRWRSPTICAETFAHDRTSAAKKRVSIVPDPPSMDVSCHTGSIQQMRDEHEQNRLREVEMHIDPIRKKSEEEVRKLSEERKTKIAEKRRMSTQESPNGVPIMQAFHKAFNDVKSGRRRSVQDFENSCHMPCLSVLDESPPDKKISADSSIAETVIAMEKMTSRSLAKDDSHDDSVSTDASQRPLLAVPPPHHNNKKRNPMPCIPPPTFLMVPAMMSLNTPPLSPSIKMENSSTLKVPRLFDCPSPCSAPSNSSHSSYTSASGSSDTYRRISMNSYGSSLTDATDSTFEIDSRRSSAWSTLRAAVIEGTRPPKPAVDITIEGTNGTPQKKVSTMSRGKLRRIATQVTRAIRHKRRESMAIRRESRATRVVAAILVAFLICWLPFFVIIVVRGICTANQVDLNPRTQFHLFIATSWLGYAHSCFNPVIYMCLNKNFRSTIRRLFAK